MIFRSANGFILVATLWILAILTIAVSFFALWTERAVQQAQALQMDVQGEIDMQNTLAHLLYLLSTQRVTIAGLTLLPDQQQPANDWGSINLKPVGDEIALDNQVYYGQGKALFALQDMGGLLSINLIAEDVLGRFLTLLQVKADDQPALIAKFRDYIDPDAFNRLQGAEKQEYQQKRLLPPRNQSLLYPTEAYRILDWPQQKTLWQDERFVQLTQTVLPILPNFNTAPTLVLQAAYNMNAEGAKRVVNLRQTTPFLSIRVIEQTAGIPLNHIEPADINFFASTVLRLTLWYQGARRMRQIQLKLTPTAAGAKPWRIDYNLTFKLLSQYAHAIPRTLSTSFFVSTLSTKTPRDH